MKKQKIYFILALFLIAQFGFATSIENAIVKGSLSIPDLKVKEVTIYKAEDGSPAVAAVSKIGNEGEFDFSLPITEAGFYYIDYGQYKGRGQLVRLYLDRKSNINLNISKDSYVLTGKNVGQNALVQKANEIYNDFAVYARISKLTYVEFFPWLDGGVEKAENFKNSIKTKDKSFDKLLKLAVDTDIKDLTYLFFRMPRSAHPERKNRPAILSKWQAGTVFSDPDILKLANGAAYMLDFAGYARMNSDENIDREDYLPNALTRISDPKLKDVFLRGGIESMYFRLDEYEKAAPKIKPYLISEASKKFLVEYEKELRKNIGKEGVNFTYNDTNDKPVSFSDFKGKYIYLDLWATWCGPCNAEIPHLKKIEEEYHDKNIVFMSISMDKMKDLQKWKNLVEKQQLKGVQLISDKDFESEIAKNYKVTGIPRFMLFDKEGKIVSDNAPRPSEPALREVLDKLLKS